MRATRDAARDPLSCLVHTPADEGGEEGGDGDFAFVQPRTATVFLNTIRKVFRSSPAFRENDMFCFHFYGVITLVFISLSLLLTLLFLFSPRHPPFSLPSMSSSSLPFSPSIFLSFSPAFLPFAPCHPPFSPSFLYPSYPSLPPPQVPPLEVKILEPEEQPLKAGRALRLLCRSAGSNPPAQLAWWQGPAHLRRGSQTVSRVQVLLRYLLCMFLALHFYSLPPPLSPLPSLSFFL